MQVSRLIVNLLDNALKYGASGGRIRLRVTAGPRIEVEDEGPGLPTSDPERVFGRYERAASRGEKGHGLGLALARAIAERHGWELGAEPTRPGAAEPGVRFVVKPKPPGRGTP
jgi:signal transduction histidine kinase